LAVLKELTIVNTETIVSGILKTKNCTDDEARYL